MKNSQFFDYLNEICRPETSQYFIHNTIPSAEDLSNFELFSVVSNPVDQQKKLGEITNIGTIEIVSQKSQAKFLILQ
jgi:hypothetical protein